MDLPSPNDYLAAIQNPKNCFADPALIAGQTVLTTLGLPKVASGNFAVVFQLTSGQARFAVKCFTRKSEGQQKRYAAISKYLRERKLPYFVEFAFLPQGIRIRGVFFPVVKMEWAVGKLLHLFVEENLRRPAVLAEAAERWRRLVADLVAARVSHGDLQHRNVVVQGSRILLIDYDDMYVPALKGEAGTEAGHEHFQHPQRTSADFGEWRDAFPAIVIYLSLRAIAADHSLWREFHLGENLILSKTDYQRSGQTRIWGRLAQSSDEEVRRLALKLQAYCRRPIRDVPTLEEALRVETPAANASAQAPAPPANQRAPKVDYLRLEQALGLIRPPTPSTSAPAQTPKPQSPTEVPVRPRVDWQLLRWLEEAQRKAQAPAPSQPTQHLPDAQAQSQPDAKPARPRKPRQRQPKKPPARPSDAPDPKSLLRRLSRTILSLELAISRLARLFLQLVMVAITTLVVLFVVVYLAEPWLQANSPGLVERLGGMLQILRDWGNAIIPTPGQVLQGVQGPNPG